METIHPGAWFPAGRPLPASADGGDALAEAAAGRGRMAWDAAAGAARRAADAARDARDTAAYAAAMNELACTHLLAGALGRAEEACGLAPAEGAPAAQRARTEVNYAVLAGLGGDGAEALARLDRADAVLGDAADTWERLLVGANRAAALALRGERDRAERAAADTLKLARRVKTEEEWIAIGQMAAGVAALGRGRRADARARLGDAVRLFARVGDALRQVQGHLLLGEIAYGGEDPIRAGTHYRDGLAVARVAAAQDAIELLTLRFEHR